MGGLNRGLRRPDSPLKKLLESGRDRLPDSFLLLALTGHAADVSELVYARGRSGKSLASLFWCGEWFVAICLTWGCVGDTSHPQFIGGIA